MGIAIGYGEGIEPKVQLARWLEVHNVVHVAKKTHI